MARNRQFERGFKGRVSSLPAAALDMESWPDLDPAALDEIGRERYTRLAKALAMHFNFAPLESVLKVAEMTKSSFYYIRDRCLTIAPDGRILGFRGLNANIRYRDNIRTKAPLSVPGSTAGDSGLFGMLLREHPEIKQGLVDALDPRHEKGEKPNEMFGDAIKEVFKGLCEQNLKPDEYPRHRTHKGMRSLQRWIEKNYAAEHSVAYQESKDAEAARLARQAGGDGASRLPDKNLFTWQIDAHKIDVDGKLVIESFDGDLHFVELRNVQLLVAHHKESGAALAARIIFGLQVTLEDLCMLMWDALAGQPDPPKVVEGHEPLEQGAGFPANVVEGMRWVMPTAIELDNALANLADAFLDVATSLFGSCAVHGPAASPRARAEIESSFAQLVKRLIHQVPSTTGTGPEDPLRETSAVPLENRVNVAVLEQCVAYYLMNCNVYMAQASGYIPPNQRLAIRLQSGSMLVVRLPVERRREYFCSKAVPATIASYTGRSLHVIYQSRRYVKGVLKDAPHLAGMNVVVRASYRNLQKVKLFLENGNELGEVQLEGALGQIPHDLRIRRMFARFKDEGSLKTRPHQPVLSWIFSQLKESAKVDEQSAMELAYLQWYFRQADVLTIANLQLFAASKTPAANDPAVMAMNVEQLKNSQPRASPPSPRPSEHTPVAPPRVPNVIGRRVLSR
jgi:hypothetical protein